MFLLAPLPFLSCPFLPTIDWVCAQKMSPSTVRVLVLPAVAAEQGRQRLQEALRKRSYVKGVKESDANFFLVEVRK